MISALADLRWEDLSDVTWLAEVAATNLKSGGKVNKQSIQHVERTLGGMGITAPWRARVRYVVASCSVVHWASRALAFLDSFVNLGPNSRVSDPAEVV